MTDHPRDSFAAFAPLFRYPDESQQQRIEEAHPHTPALDAFAEEMSRLDLTARQSAYTATFDLAPSCTPYLGVHLFGDENPDRARLMVGLRQAYRRAGMTADRGELPDHVAEVLEFAAHDSDEAGDLVRLVLIPALTKMDAILAPTTNPWRHLVAAALRASSESAPAEVAL
jgi:nitrate reductase delta subunit